MKARKRQTRARRPRVSSQDVAPGPTPQTVAKLRRDLMLLLYQKRRLRIEHLQAAEDIRRIWQAFSRSLGATAVNPDTLATGRQPVQGRQPLDWFTATEEVIWRNRYRPWAREMGSSACGGTIRVTRLQAVLELVVENRSLRQVEGFYRMRHGAAADHLCAALQRYAEIAGWIGESGRALDV
jgi:hypothetical protein